MKLREDKFRKLLMLFCLDCCFSSDFQNADKEDIRVVCMRSYGGAGVGFSLLGNNVLKMKTARLSKMLMSAFKSARYFYPEQILIHIWPVPLLF
jgi:hypothetical protein